MCGHALRGIAELVCEACVLDCGRKVQESRDLERGGEGVMERSLLPTRWSLTLHHEKKSSRGCHEAIAESYLFLAILCFPTQSVNLRRT